MRTTAIHHSPPQRRPSMRTGTLQSQSQSSLDSDLSATWSYHATWHADSTWSGSCCSLTSCTETVDDDGGPRDKTQNRVKVFWSLLSRLLRLRMLHYNYCKQLTNWLTLTYMDERRNTYLLAQSLASTTQQTNNHQQPYSICIRLKWPFQFSPRANRIYLLNSLSYTCVHLYPTPCPTHRWC